MKRTKPHKNKRILRSRILIMCEGRTERNYFQAIKEDPDYKQALIAIDPQIVEAKKSAPILVVREAIKKVKKAVQEANEYVGVWVVFDHDNRTERQEAYDLAISNDFNIAFSAIAFEKWFLLHFKRSSRAFPNADELKRELKKYYENYEKAKQNDFANLKDRLKIAQINAEWLRTQVLEENKHITDYNPWTDVDKLVDELISYKEY